MYKKSLAIWIVRARERYIPHRLVVVLPHEGVLTNKSACVCASAGYCVEAPVCVCGLGGKSVSFEFFCTRALSFTVLVKSRTIREL